MFMMTAPVAMNPIPAWALIDHISSVVVLFQASLPPFITIFKLDNEGQDKTRIAKLFYCEIN